MSLQQIDRKHQDAVRLLEAGWPMVVHSNYERTNLDGSKTTLGFGPFRSIEDAAESYQWALDAGWSRPRWWQFWRWGDQPRKPPTTVSDASSGQG